MQKEFLTIVIGVRVKEGVVELLLWWGGVYKCTYNFRPLLYIYYYIIIYLKKYIRKNFGSNVIVLDNV